MPGTESWPYYIEGLLALHEGSVGRALAQARTALEKSRESGHSKNVWRCEVLLAHALAEALRPAEALAELPPISSRVEGQDVVYDTEARVRTRLAAGDPAAAFADIRDTDPSSTDLGSPADSIAEAAGSEPDWLKAFVSRMPNQDVDPPLLRAEVARGRLALAEGRFEDAVRTLARAVMSFRDEGFLLDAWHASRALAEAQFSTGATEQARALL